VEGRPDRDAAAEGLVTICSCHLMAFSIKTKVLDIKKPISVDNGSDETNVYYEIGMKTTN
jgi:hypothetical protein